MSNNLWPCCPHGYYITPSHKCPFEVSSKGIVRLSDAHPDAPPKKVVTFG